MCRHRTGREVRFGLGLVSRDVTRQCALRQRCGRVWSRRRRGGSRTRGGRAWSIRGHGSRGSPRARRHLLPRSIAVVAVGRIGTGSDRARVLWTIGGRRPPVRHLWTFGAGVGGESLSVTGVASWRGKARAPCVGARPGLAPDGSRRTREEEEWKIDQIIGSSPRGEKGGVGRLGASWLRCTGPRSRFRTSSCRPGGSARYGGRGRGGSANVTRPDR